MHRLLSLEALDCASEILSNIRRCSCHKLCRCHNMKKQISKVAKFARNATTTKNCSCHGRS